MSRASIEGITLHGPPLFADVAFRLVSGVDVFYGRNGAGKTRLLSAIVGTLRGVEVMARLEGLIHVRLNHAAQHGDDELCADLHFALTAPRYSKADRHATYGSTEDLMARLEERRIGNLRAHLLDEDQVRQWVGKPELNSWIVLSPLDDAALVLSALRTDELGTDVRGVWQAAASAYEETWNASAADTDEEPLVGTICNYGAHPNVVWLTNHPWAAAPWQNLEGFVPGPFAQIIEADEEVDLFAATLELFDDKLAAGLPPSASPEDMADFARFGGTAQIGLSMVDDEFIVRSEVTDLIDLVTDIANHIYSNLLVDAPRLALQMTTPELWFRNVPSLVWVAADPSDTQVPLNDLSAAQRRWALLAIRVAIADIALKFLEDDDPRSTRLLVVDEPELALHPTAQRFLAAGLLSIASTYDLQVVMTSHSPVFLQPDRFRLHHVSRETRGLVAVEELPSAFAVDTATLGLEAADLLALTRVLVIVEGRHDELILTELFGDRLKELGATVIATRGASALSSVAEAELLFDFTDARVLAVLDNLGNPLISVLWRDSQTALDAGDAERARQILAAGLSSRVAEQKFLKEFFIRAIDRARGDRVSVFGLGRPDIIDYLPVNAICKRAKGRSWDDLRAQRAEEGKNFKEWARQAAGFDDDDATIRQAVGTMDAIPNDLVALMDTIEAVARSPWQRTF